MQQWMSQPLSEFNASSEEKLSYKDSELAFANKHNVCLERLHTSKSPLTDCARKSSMVYYKQCSYMSKIMPIIMLVVVNYDPFQLPKNTKNAPTIYSKFGKNSLITM